MSPHDPSSRENPHDEAPRRVQDDVSELLRHTANTETPRMPQDVAARIRASMASEFGTTFTTPETNKTGSEQTPIIVPLPVRQPKSEHKKSVTNPQISEAPASGASIHSFEAAKERREGRRRNVWAAGAAAAAVVVTGGVVGGVMNNQGASVAGKPTSATSTQLPGAANISDVRITQSNTKYTKTNLVSEVKKNASSTAPLSSSVSQDNMTTKQGVNSCISALGEVIKSRPQSVHADFGTYDNQPAVVVTLNYGSGKQQQIVVVPRGCGQSVKTVLAGPTPV